MQLLSERRKRVSVCFGLTLTAIAKAAVWFNIPKERTVRNCHRSSKVLTGGCSISENVADGLNRVSAPGMLFLVILFHDSIVVFCLDG